MHTNNTNRKFLAIILLAGFVLLNSPPISYAQIPFIDLLREKISEKTVEKIKEIEKAEPPSYIKECPSGETRLYNICYKDGGAELKAAIEKTKNIRPARGSRCDSGFHYLITNKISGAGECYRLNSQEYKDALVKARVIGDVRGYTTQIKIPCDPKITGACPSLATPAGYIARIYIFGLMIAGLAAFGGIIYGSLKYVLSAGNIGSQQDAKDQITNAVLGLVLLLGAYIVLYTINPDLVNLRNPQLEVINLAELRQQEEGGGEQRLIANGGGDDPLCKLAVNAGITVGLTGTARTGQEVGQIGQDISGAVGEFFGSGGEKKGSYCFKCTDGATKNDGVCRCIAPFVEYGGGCVLKESIPKTVE